MFSSIPRIFAVVLGASTRFVVDNEPVQIGDKTYDNDGDKRFDTHFIPTLSLGSSW